MSGRSNSSSPSPVTPVAQSAAAQTGEPNKKFISVDTTNVVPESAMPALTFDSRTRMTNNRTMERLNKEIASRIAEIERQNQTMTNLTWRHEELRVDYNRFSTQFLTNSPEEYLPLDMIRPELLANHDYTARIRVWSVRLHVPSGSVE